MEEEEEGGRISPLKGIRVELDKMGVSKLIKEYQIGDKVAIKINPAVHNGMPYRRYQGRIGTIVERRGRAYVIEIKVGRRKVKKIIARPEHIKSVL